MAAPKRITPDMLPGMLKLMGEGQSAAKIAAWIEAEFKVRVSGKAVALHLKKSSKERSEVAREVVREKLGKTIAVDIDVIDEVLREARKLLKPGKDNAELAAELDRLSLIDIGDLFDDKGALKPLKDIPESARRAISSIEVESVFEKRGGRQFDDGDGEERVVSAGHVTKVKFWDKVQALKEAVKLRSTTADRASALAAMDRMLRAVEMKAKLMGLTDDPNKDKPQGVILLPAETPDE